MIFYNGKTNDPIRSLTTPHIVIIICSYLLGFNLNLSEATLNILRHESNVRQKFWLKPFFFFQFFSGVNSPFLGFFVSLN